MGTGLDGNLNTEMQGIFYIFILVFILNKLFLN